MYISMIYNQSWSLTLARLCYFTTREYNFNIKGAKNSPNKRNRWQTSDYIHISFSAVRDLLLIELIYTGNTKTCLPKFDFPRDFNLAFTKNHRDNKEKVVKHFEKVIFPPLQKAKEKNRYSKESLIIMDLVKGQDNEVWKSCIVQNKSCEVLIVLYNLTKSFRRLIFLLTNHFREI